MNSNITLDCISNGTSKVDICTSWQNEQNSIDISFNSNGLSILDAKFFSSQSFLFVQCDDDLFYINDTFDSHYCQCVQRELMIFSYNDSSFTYTVVIFWGLIPGALFICFYVTWTYRYKIKDYENDVSCFCMLILTILALTLFVLVTGMLLFWFGTGIAGTLFSDDRVQVAPQIVWFVALWGCIYAIGGEALVFMLQLCYSIGKHWEP